MHVERLTPAHAAILKASRHLVTVALKGIDCSLHRATDGTKITTFATAGADPALIVFGPIDLQMLQGWQIGDQLEMADSFIKETHAGIDLYRIAQDRDRPLLIAGAHDGLYLLPAGALGERLDAHDEAEAMAE